MGVPEGVVHRSCLPIWIANYHAFLKEASGPRPGG